MAEDQKITGTVSATRETFNFTKTKNGFSQEISVGKTTTQVVEFTNKPAKKKQDQLLLSINGQVEGKNAELVSFYKGANGGIYLKFSQDFVYGEEYAEFRKNTPFFEAFNRNFFKEYEDKSRDALSFPIEEFVIDKNLDIQIKCANQTKSFGAVFSAFGVQMQLGQQKALCKYTDHANNLVIDKSVFDLALDGKSVCKFGKGMDFKSPVFQNSVNMYAAILQERAMKDNQYVTVKEEHGNSTISTIPYYPYAEGGEKNAEFLNVYTEGTKHYAYFNLAEGDKRLPGTYYEIDTMDLIEPAGEKSRPVVAYTLIDPKNEKVRYHFQQELSENSAEQFKQNASFLLEYSNGKQKEVRNDLTHVINVKEYGVGESARLKRSAQALNTEKPEAEKTEEQGIVAEKENNNSSQEDDIKSDIDQPKEQEETANFEEQQADDSFEKQASETQGEQGANDTNKEQKEEKTEEKKKSRVPGFLKSSKFWFGVAVAVTVGCVFLPASVFSIAIPFAAFAAPEIIRSSQQTRAENKQKAKKVKAVGKEKSNEMSNEAQAVAEKENTKKLTRRERKLLKKKEKEDLRKEKIAQIRASDMDGIEQFNLYDRTREYMSLNTDNPTLKDNIPFDTARQIKYSENVKDSVYELIGRVSKNTKKSKLTDKESKRFQNRKELNDKHISDLKTMREDFVTIATSADNSASIKNIKIAEIDASRKNKDSKKIKEFTAEANERGLKDLDQYKEYLRDKIEDLKNIADASTEIIENIEKSIDARELENGAIDGLFAANKEPGKAIEILEQLHDRDEKSAKLETQRQKLKDAKKRYEKRLAKLTEKVSENTNATETKQEENTTELTNNSTPQKEKTDEGNIKQ